MAQNFPIVFPSTLDPGETFWTLVHFLIPIVLDSKINDDNNDADADADANDDVEEVDAHKFW